MSKLYILLLLPLSAVVAFYFLEQYEVLLPYILACTFLFTVFEISVFVAFKKLKLSESTATMMQLAVSGLRFFMVMGLILVPIVTKHPDKKILLVSLLLQGVYYIIIGNILQLKAKK